MDASSAIEHITKNIPKHTTNVSQMAPAVPPFESEKTLVVSVNSQVRPSTTTNPTMEKNRNRRCLDVSHHELKVIVISILLILASCPVFACPAGLSKAVSLRSFIVRLEMLLTIGRIIVPS